MDFGTLLHAASNNDKVKKKEPIRCYSTKFEPPKKQQRTKELSANIKKFLAKKEAEEKRKLDEAQKKKEELLALRAQDKKATRRVNVMLKMTKSANQSAIEDAVDSNNTSVTLAGSAQPDEDDYGYVSQEAAAFYSKMMEKYNKIPDEPKFNMDKKKKVSTNLNSTKDRVRAALEREKEEANMPHKRKRKHQEETATTGREREEQEETADMPPPKAKRRPAAPPPMAFADLLKLAEKKQFEPIVIEQKPKEEEKLFTKKQKKELEREKEWRDRKAGKLPPLDVSKLPPPKRTNGAAATGAAAAAAAQSKPESKVPSKVPMGNIPQRNNNNKIASDNSGKKSVPPKANARPPLPPPSTSQNSPRKPKENYQPVSSSSKQKPIASKQLPPQQSNNKNGDPKRFKQLDARGAVAPPKGPPKQFPPADVRGSSRPFPPPYGSHFQPRDVKRKPAASSRRILDDDDEDEYDSEMDDFIDDGPDDELDLSETLRTIFKYDRSKYRNIDDNDVDDMESSFAQVAREESISLRIGKWEDEREMMLEEEEKKRKTFIRNKVQKRM